MKDTPITNEYIRLINDGITELSAYTDYEDEPYVCMYPGDFADELGVCINNLQGFDIELVKREFVDTLEDYNKLFFQMKVFEHKFERLLNWKHDYENGVVENISKYNQEFYEFTNYQIHFQVDVRTHEYNRLKSLYINLSARITILKQSIKTMLVHYEELGRIYLQANNLKIVPKEDKIAQNKVQLKSGIVVKPASRHKTDVIKILSAMYDARMFVGDDGESLTNKQKLMDAFGEFFQEDFSAYSASLSQAKTRDDKTFLKPFKEIEKEAIRYFNEVTEK